MHYVPPVQHANTESGAWSYCRYRMRVFASATMRRFHIGLLAVMMPLIIILWETWYRCWGGGHLYIMCIYSFLHVYLYYTHCAIECCMYVDKRSVYVSNSRQKLCYFGRGSALTACISRHTLDVWFIERRQVAPPCTNFKLWFTLVLLRKKMRPQKIRRQKNQVSLYFITVQNSYF